MRAIHHQSMDSEEDMGWLMGGAANPLEVTPAPNPPPVEEDVVMDDYTPAFDLDLPNFDNEELFAGWASGVIPAPAELGINGNLSPKLHRSLFWKFELNPSPSAVSPPAVLLTGPNAFDDQGSFVSHMDPEPTLVPHHELLPLTTTTSHTPSVSLLHSAQPLFFSAQQYFSRNSLDTGSIMAQDYLTRPLMDLGKLVRSNPQVGNRYNSFSFSNILPFMGERNQRVDDELLLGNEPRHLIRNIFSKIPQTLSSDNLMILDPPHSDDGKIKKPKRSIFTRFQKAPVVAPEEVSEPITEEDELVVLDETEPPDYGGLFENVVKWKKAPKKEIKKEDEEAGLLQEPTNRLESSFAQASLQSLGLASNVAASVNSTSSLDESESAFSASKRLLGSKLTRKKQAPTLMPVEQMPMQLIDGFMVAPTANGKPVATMICKGVEVEVDLALLDLPPDTEIFPTNVINQKNRTRGRKENKEADLADAAKVYLCNYCSRRFKRQEHLKRHFRLLHTFEKPYNCTLCNKKFSRQDNLNQHLKTHKEEYDNDDDGEDGEEA